MFFYYSLQNFQQEKINNDLEFVKICKVVVRVHYRNPVTGDWDYHDGIGAKELQVKNLRQMIEVQNQIKIKPETAIAQNRCYEKPIFSRVWEMPNKNTFDIKCINRLIHKYHNGNVLSIDPFANKNRIAKVTNDLDPEMEADFCLDAIDFLKTFEDGSVYLT